MGIVLVAILVILGIIMNIIMIGIKEGLEESEAEKWRLRNEQREKQREKEYYKEKILKNTLWFAPPKKARILVDTNILTYDTPDHKDTYGRAAVVYQWRDRLPKIVKAHQLKIIVLPEVYEELYQNGKNTARNYLYECRKKIPAENLEMELPLEHFGRRGRFADKKLLEYMLKNDGVYLFSFDQDLINRLLSRSSDRNVKKRICEQGFSPSPNRFELGKVLDEHFK